MKLPLSWLKEYVNTTLPPQELAQRLTMAGTEVSSMERIGGQWENIFVGQVTAVSPHPNADRLRLATISLGKESHTVVCGAPNIAPGQRVAFARVGAQLIDGHTGQPVTLQAARIRGVVSQGMACSEKELGLSEEHTGILVLPPEAHVGVPLEDVLGDFIWDLKVTPNRPDLLSVLGIAREVAALTGQPLLSPSLDYPEADPSIGRMASIDIQDPDLCPRYCGGLIHGVKIGPSPHWMQERLSACGLRPINNIVDITNYVMLEFGQPMHAFDFETLKGRRIIVRRPREGEAITTLDGSSRPLETSMLVIADGERPVAVAGVMGGLETEVTDRTTSILLESANFNSVNLRQSAATLKMRTEASLRFEKGLNTELPPMALRRAMALMLELAGGQAAAGILDAYPGRKEPRPIHLTTREVKRVLGLDLDIEKIRSVLTSLGFGCQPGPEGLEVSVPYWRSDTSGPADLAEEVARIIGYEQIPTTLLRGRPPEYRPQPLQDFRERVRDIMVACGFQEVITYSLTSLERLQKVGAPLPALRIANPLSPEQEYLRTSLRQGLLSTIGYNQKYEERGLRLFELGRIYLPREQDLPREKEMLGAVLVGPRAPLSWLGGEDPLDFYDARGVVEALLERLGLAADFVPSQDASLRPGHQAHIQVQGQGIGLVGKTHPALADAFSVTGQAYLLEIDLEALLPLATSARRRFQSLPHFPAILRDIALVLDRDIPARRVEEFIRDAPLVSQLTLFDLYTGTPIPPGKKSLAYRIVFQSTSRTLTNEEVDQAQEKLLERLRKELGATLRA